MLIFWVHSCLEQKIAILLLELFTLFDVPAPHITDLIKIMNKIKEFKSDMTMLEGSCQGKKYPHSISHTDTKGRIA